MTIGIDEVGRGALAGPLVICCVALNNKVSGLKDSKKLSKIERLNLYKQITNSANFCSFGWVWAHEIDLYGLTKATQIAIIRGLRNYRTNKNLSIIIDGNYNYLKDYAYNTQAIVNADDSISEVSAASIAAKVVRDNYMTNLDKYFPSYNFKKNVGYGTKDHINCLKSIGPSKIHRLTFLSKII